MRRPARAHRRQHCMRKGTRATTTPQSAHHAGPSWTRLRAGRNRLSRGTGRGDEAGGPHQCEVRGGRLQSDAAIKGRAGGREPCRPPRAIPHEWRGRRTRARRPGDRGAETATNFCRQRAVQHLELIIRTARGNTDETNGILASLLVDQKLRTGCERSARPSKVRGSLRPARPRWSSARSESAGRRRVGWARRDIYGGHDLAVASDGRARPPSHTKAPLSSEPRAVESHPVLGTTPMPETPITLRRSLGTRA